MRKLQTLIGKLRSDLNDSNLPDEVRHRICRGNAERVYGLKKNGKQERKESHFLPRKGAAIW